MKEGKELIDTLISPESVSHFTTMALQHELLLVLEGKIEYGSNNYQLLLDIDNLRSEIERTDPGYINKFDLSSIPEQEKAIWIRNNAELKKLVFELSHDAYNLLLSFCIQAEKSPTQLILMCVGIYGIGYEAKSKGQELVIISEGEIYQRIVQV